MGRERHTLAPTAAPPQKNANNYPNFKAQIFLMVSACIILQLNFKKNFNLFAAKDSISVFDCYITIAVLFLVLAMLLID